MPPRPCHDRQQFLDSLGRDEFAAAWAIVRPVLGSLSFITPGEDPFILRGMSRSGLVDICYKARVLDELRRQDGNVTAAAEELMVSRRHLGDVKHALDIETSKSLWQPHSHLGMACAHILSNIVGTLDRKAMESLEIAQSEK